MTDAHAADAKLFGLPTKVDGAEPARDPVEKLASDYLDAFRRGETPTMEEYIARHPHLAEQIRELFPLIAALEDWKSERETTVTRGAMPDKFNIRQLGDCRIVREIGRGGMGVVFEAVQSPIGRQVAVKLLPWKSPGQSRWRERFQVEARTAAALRHPHIVPIYSFGEQDGMCFYVMQLIEGVGLNRLIERLREPPGIVTPADIAVDFRATTGEPRDTTTTPAPTTGGVLRRGAWRAMAQIALQAADALRYAHQQSTLHRDIKPANLLIDPRGTVFVADFGLAVSMEDATGNKRGGMAGTLRYMPPEQIQGRFDERSDVYSLGLTLYELCTLTPAFDAPDKQSLVEKILGSSPARPRQVNPEIPRPLERIILKAIAPDAAKRYQRAAELVTDLRAFLNRREWRFLKWFRGRATRG
jgi:serine/threonine protein kinase